MIAVAKRWQAICSVAFVALASCSASKGGGSSAATSQARGSTRPAPQDDAEFRALLTRGLTNEYRVDYSVKHRNDPSSTTGTDVWVAQRGGERVVHQLPGRDESWWYAFRGVNDNESSAPRQDASLYKRADGSIVVCSDANGCIDFGNVVDADSLVDLTVIAPSEATNPYSDATRYPAWGGGADSQPTEIAGHAVTCRIGITTDQPFPNVCVDSEDGTLLSYETMSATITALRVGKPSDADFALPKPVQKVASGVPGANGGRVTGEKLFEALNRYRAQATFKATYFGSDDAMTLAQRPPLRTFEQGGSKTFLRDDKMVVTCNGSDCEAVGKYEGADVESWVGLAAGSYTRMGQFGRGGELSVFLSGGLRPIDGAGVDDSFQNRLIFGRLSLCGGSQQGDASPTANVRVMVCLDRETGAITLFDVDAGSNSIREVAVRFGAPSEAEFVIPGPVKS